MVSGNNSAPFLTSIAGKTAPAYQKGYFRTAANEETAGSVAARYAYLKRGLKKAATINDNDIYTAGLTESFKKAFIELGGEIVLDTSINKGDSEMLPILTAVIHSGAEILFFPLFQPEGNQILLQARKLPEFADTLLIGSGSLIEKSFLEATGEAAKGMCFVGPVKPEGSAVSEMNRKYKARYGEDPAVSYYLSAYDGANLLFTALEKAVVHSENGTIYLGRQRLRDVLYATKEQKGVTGTLSCSSFGDCADAAFHVLQLQDPEQGLKGLEANIVYH
jgi:branched-chain amino acid transport system substrate-binding protein